MGGCENDIKYRNDSLLQIKKAFWNIWKCRSLCFAISSRLIAKRIQFFIFVTWTSNASSIQFSIFLTKQVKYWKPNFAGSNIIVINRWRNVNLESVRSLYVQYKHCTRPGLLSQVVIQSFFLFIVFSGDSVVKYRVHRKQLFSEEAPEIQSHLFNFTFFAIEVSGNIVQIMFHYYSGGTNTRQR